jgi:hypothetical protein
MARQIFELRSLSSKHEYNERMDGQKLVPLEPVATDNYQGDTPQLNGILFSRC